MLFLSRTDVFFPLLTNAHKVCVLGWVFAEREQSMAEEVRLADRYEIELLMKRYCLYFDTKQPDALAALFTTDARVDYGPEVEPIHGRETLRNMVAQGARTRFESTNHQICNEIVIFDGDHQAYGTSHLYAWHKYFGSDLIGHLYGGYKYQFTQINGEWLISDLKLFASGTKDFHRSRMHDFREILES